VIRALLASLLAVAALAVVSAAAQAQDASCSQYCDPLTGGNGHHHGGGGGGGGGGGHHGSSSSANQNFLAGSAHSPSSSGALNAASGKGSNSSDPSRRSSGQLPLTGFDVVSVVLAGFTSLGAGLALCAATARRRRA